MFVANRVNQANMNKKICWVKLPGYYLPCKTRIAVNHFFSRFSAFSISKFFYKSFMLHQPLP
ncbi:hypothetical protein B0E42_01435 [Pseudomonas sp. A25(2017)]|nr:hypothetical protein B0E42_01435 [Pseudomonas sp. A25(2017)]